ncbi:MAG: CoA transferase [Chloroflexi bacterium]|nr:CoA transferase [Chloroflexota bacterium]
MLPLAGIRVLEFCDIWIGPTLCSFLGDLGAEVWKIETIHRMSPSRGLHANPPRGPTYPGMEPGGMPFNRNSYFNAHNRSKYGFTLDVRDEETRSRFLELASVCDALVENFPAGGLAKLGVGYDTLRRARPDIVLLSLSPYGQTGPYRSHNTFGFCIDSMCGHASLRGYRGDDITQTAPAYPQDPGGVHVGMFALLAAMHHRHRTGEGQWIDLSQAEAYIDRIGESIVDYSMNRRVPERMGNRHEVMAPHGVYPCRGTDRWVTIAVASDNEWRRLCEAMGDPAWSRDAKFATKQGRQQNAKELDRRLADWTRTRDDHATMLVLQAHRIMCSPVMDARQLFEDPHLRARGFFEPIVHPTAGRHEYPGRAWRFSETPAAIQRPANLLGEHNDLLFHSLLGMRPEHVTRMRDKGLIGDRFATGAEH